jgi:hypothetical protein
MSPPLSNQPSGRDILCHALAELRAGHDDLQALVSEIFDRLNGVADEFLGRKDVRGQPSQQAEWETLQREIDRLASLAAEMANSAANQKRPTTPRNRGD